MAGAGTIEILAVTLRIAGGAAALLALPALALGWCLARREFRGKSVVETIVALPLVLPPTAIGYLLLELFARHGPLGGATLGFDPGVLFSARGATLASAVVAFPLAVRTARLAFEGVDPRLEALGRSLGLARLEVLRRITLPLARRGLLAALLLGFSRALGEFGATVIVAGNIPGRTQTLALAIFADIQVGDTRHALGLVALCVALSFATVFAVERLLREPREGAVSATFSFALRAELAPFVLEVELDSAARRLGLFGPSGAGKTSLLEVLAGWRAPSAGRAAIGGRELFDTARGVRLPSERRGLGYVPQDGLLFPHWTVEGNLRAGAARARGTPEAFARVVEVLELASLLERRPGTLSGGERQRVALGRALCSGPAALLLDEPLASLDHALRRRILPYLVRVAEEFALPMLIVSHEPLELAVLCDEVCVLERGRVAGRGAPADVFAASWRTDGHEGAPTNVLRGTVGAREDDVARVVLAPGITLDVSAPDLVPGARVVLGLAADEILVATRRPEGLSARNVLAASAVTLDVPLEQGQGGVLLRARLEPAGPALDVLLTRASTRSLALASGASLFLVIKSNSVRVLSALAPA